MTAPNVTLMMTRPRVASDRFVASLSIADPARVMVCYSPLIDIVPVATDITFQNTDAVLFTSQNAVTVASKLTARRDLPCVCVGSTTTQAAQNAGWDAQCAGETADDLVAWTMAGPSQRYLHLSGRHTRGDIADRLSTADRPTRAVVVYDQNLNPLTDQAQAILNTDASVIVPLFSPRTARHFVDQLTGTASIHVVAISDAAAEPLKTRAIQTLRVVKRPTSDMMRTEVEILMNQLCRVEGG